MMDKFHPGYFGKVSCRLVLIACYSVHELIGHILLCNGSSTVIDLFVKSGTVVMDGSGWLMVCPVGAGWYAVLQ